MKEQHFCYKNDIAFAVLVVAVVILVTIVVVVVAGTELHW